MRPTRFPPGSVREFIERMTSQTSVIRHRPEIDGLRSLAVLPVVLFHAASPWLPGGYLGVDLFFVISGFLISSIIFREVELGSFSFAGFYERRIRRIIPALAATLLCTLVAGHFILTPGEYEEFFQSLTATASFSSNIYFFLKSGYFEALSESRPLLHTWSLSVEEQFYLLFPILALLLHRLVGHWKPFIITAIIVLSACIALHWGRTATDLGFYATPARVWELLAGTMAAWFYARMSPRPMPGAISKLLEAACLAAILISYELVEFLPLPTGLLALPSVVSTAILLVIMKQDSLAGRLLSWRPSVAVGLISYSMYLVHQPVLVFTRVMSQGELSTEATTFALALIAVLSWLSWRFVEQPFRSLSFLSRKAIFGLAGAVTTACILLGIVGHALQGFPQRFDPHIVKLAATAQPSPFRDSCHTWGTDYRKPRDACRFFVDSPSWATLGDSHSIELAYALAERLRPANDGVVTLSFSGCMPALSISTINPGCQAWTKEAVSFLESDTSLRNVVIAYRHGAYVTGYGGGWGDLHGGGRHYASASDPGALDAYWESFKDLVSRIAASGKQVYVIMPIPDLPMPVEVFVFRLRLPVENTTSTVPRQEPWRNFAGIEARFAALGEIPGVHVIDPDETLCDAGHCRYMGNGEVLYFDDNHLSVAGAELVIGDMFLKLRSTALAR